MDNILRLGDVLKEKGISGKDLAEAIGASPTYVSQLVNNHKFPRKEMLIAIAAHLDIDVRDLFYSSKAGKPLQALQEIKRIADQALEQS